VVAQSSSTLKASSECSFVYIRSYEALCVAFQQSSKNFWFNLSAGVHRRQPSAEGVIKCGLFCALVERVRSTRENLGNCFVLQCMFW